MTTLMMRPYTGEADLEAVCTLLNLVDATDKLNDSYSPDQLRHEFAEPNCDWNNDLRLWEDADGRLVAFAQTWMPTVNSADQQLDAYLYVRIHPEARHTPIEDDIIAWGEARVRQVGNERGLPAMVRSGAIEHDGYSRALYQRWGMHEVRRFYRMYRPLDQPIAAPQPPPGYHIRHIGSDEAEAWVELYNMSFIDHWNYHPLPLEVYQHRVSDPHYQAERDLVAVAPDGTLGGFCQCWVDSEDNQRKGTNEGYIALLGTRRGHRNQGLGRALLLAGLQRLKDDGISVAKLGVDAENPTGALRLYEECGFQVEYSNVVYGRMLGDTMTR